MSQKYDEIIKFIIIGDSGTGKSCLLQSFLDGVFHEEQTQTIGVEFGAKVVALSGKRIKLQVWDTAGQERYRSVTRSYYRGAVGVMLVYDTSKLATFESIPTWLEEAKRLITQDVAFILVGNKSDVRSESKVSTNEAAAFAHENNLMFLETSAKTGTNVEEAFMQLGKRAIQMLKGPQGANPPVNAKSNDALVLGGDGSVLVMDDDTERRGKKVCSC